MNGDELLDGGGVPAVPADRVIELDASNENKDKSLLRWLVWAIAVAMFTGYVLVVRVHTRLGVEAPRLDKNGRDYVWRAWWRARHQIVAVGSDTAVVVVYISLSVIFLALCALACWIALVPDEPAKRTTLPPDAVES